MKKMFFAIGLFVMGSAVFAQRFSGDGHFAANFNVMLRAFTIVTNVVNNNDILKIVVISSIVAFILAKILSSCTRCIIVWGWWDLIITLIPGVIIFCYLYFLEKVPEKYDLPINIGFSVFLVISLLISLIINISNSGILGILFALVSVITKIILIVLVPIIIVLYIGALSSGTPDKRYRDGTKRNERTRMLVIVSVIAVFFVASLIKVDAND